MSQCGEAKSNATQEPAHIGDATRIAETVCAALRKTTTERRAM